MRVANAIVPRGKGVYLKDHPSTPADAVRLCADLGCSWAAVNVGHPATAAACKAAGLRVWLYSLPGLFDDGLGNLSTADDEWHVTVTKLVSSALAVGADGIIVDPEMRWASSTHAERTAFAAALREARRVGLGVGVTTHTGLTSLAVELAPLLGPAGCWASPQVYDHQLGEALTRPRDVAVRWDVQPWPIVPSVGTWHGNGSSVDLEACRKYFAALPAWDASILWYAGVPTAGERAIMRTVWTVASVAPIVTALVVALGFVLRRLVA